MFKRFTCMILSLVLLVALLPAGAIEASAASNATSSNAITILKKLESFSSGCTKTDGYAGANLYYSGYGTKCTKPGAHDITSRHSTECNTSGIAKDGTKCTEAGPHGAVHTIRETEATEALKAAMKTIDTAINTFASNRGISLSQQQHDALAIFSFENGTAWTKGSDDLQNAVVTGITGSDFLDVMLGWKKATTAEDNRRKIETNIYLFGDYTTNVGALAENMKEADDNDDEEDITDLVTDDRVKVTVTNDYINVRKTASLFGTQVGKVYYGDVLRITSTKEADGYLWGRYVNEDYEKVGYVALMYTNYDELINAYKNYEDEEESAEDSIVAKAEIVATAYVNVRSGPGTKNPIVSALRLGDKVDLYQVSYVNGQKWGQCSTGWFSLAYATLSNQKTDKYNTNDLAYLSYRFDYKFNNDVDLYKSDLITSNGVTIDAGKAVQLANITASGGETWAEVFQSGKSKGWALISGFDGANVTMNDGDFAANAYKYTTKVEVITRETPQISGVRKDTLAAGTEFDVIQIKADANTIWGYTADALGKYQGWVDLSTQYVSRNGAKVEVEEDDSDEKVDLATIINCVEVNVREKANIFSDKVMTLPVGTTLEVREGPENGTRMTGWYRLKVETPDDSEAWVRGDYLDLFEGTKGQINYGKKPTSPSGDQAATGRGMVANTYGGVNVRSAPGTANAKVTKLLPGTEVNILEVINYGATQWGRIDQGWLCMDYIAMMDYDDLPGTNTTITSTKAVYEGTVVNDQTIYKEPNASNAVRTEAAGHAITVHELLMVTEVIEDDGIKTTTEKRFWARVNDGYIPDPQNNIELNPLYEQVFTVTETDLLKVREAAGADQTREDMDLKKGDQVKITELAIVGDQIWGMFEHDDLGADGEGWICLSYCTIGAVDTSVKVEDTEENKNPAAQQVPMSMGNTGAGTYAGVIKGADEVRIRKDATTNSAEVTTLKKGAAITITETKLIDGRSWGYCGSGWINLIYVDLTPVGVTAIDAKVIAVDNTLCYESSETGANVVGSYANRAVVHIYEEVNGMYKTDMGWVAKGNFI